MTRRIALLLRDESEAAGRVLGSEAATAEVGEAIAARVAG
jgi:hypothetical protein